MMKWGVAGKDSKGRVRQIDRLSSPPRVWNQIYMVPEFNYHPMTQPQGAE